VRIGLAEARFFEDHRGAREHAPQPRQTLPLRSRAWWEIGSPAQELIQRVNSTGKGLICGFWVEQRPILQHAAVGWFLTHGDPSEIIFLLLIHLRVYLAHMKSKFDLGVAGRRRSAHYMASWRGAACQCGIFVVEPRTRGVKSS
jgi:hypothetical protein